MNRTILLLVMCVPMLFTLGCSSGNKVFEGDAESQAQLRSIQTRAVDAEGKIELMHAIMSTLQDLGFVIDDANDMIGTISATKLDKYALQITVSVRKRGLDGKQFLVRANIQHAMKSIEKPEPYQKFFASLDKGKFLTVNEAE